MKSGLRPSTDPKATLSPSHSYLNCSSLSLWLPAEPSSGQEVQGTDAQAGSLHSGSSPRARLRQRLKRAELRSWFLLFLTRSPCVSSGLSLPQWLWGQEATLAIWCTVLGQENWVPPLYCLPLSRAKENPGQEKPLGPRLPGVSSSCTWYSSWPACMGSCHSTSPTDDWGLHAWEREELERNEARRQERKGRGEGRQGHGTEA